MARAWPAFRYWLTVAPPPWRGTMVTSVANPMLFLLGIGLGLGHLVDHGHSATLYGLSYTAFFAPGLLAASAMQTGYIEGGGRVTAAAGSAGSYPAAAWAVGLRSIRNIQAGFRFVVMPMYMFSGTFFALDQLPPGVRLVASAL